MSRDQVLAAMHAADLVSPRIIPVRLRTGVNAFDLWAGAEGERRTVRLPTTAKDSDLTAALAALKG